MRAEHEAVLDRLVGIDVLTREQADSVRFRQVLPTLMPCQMVMDEATWEAIARWYQTPDRELDPAGPEYHEAVARRFAIYYGEHDASVRDSLERANECRANPPGKSVAPMDKVIVEGNLQFDSFDRNGAIHLQSDEERRAAKNLGKIRRQVDRG
jgi:hypothetical protein